MSPSRVAASIGLGTLLVAWLSSAIGVSPQPRAIRAPRAEADAQIDRLAADVQAQASRLRKRLAAAPAPRGPSRNPFSFVRREFPSRSAAEVPAEATTAEPVVVEPALSLIGIAETRTAAGPVRTAMIVGDDEELHMVTEGQFVAGRFLVLAVAADAVELKDNTTGAVRRLALQ